MSLRSKFVIYLSALLEDRNGGNLQRHAYYYYTFQNGEPENPTLGREDCGVIPVMSGVEAIISP